METGELRKLDSLSKDERIKTIELFTGVWGVGKNTAEAVCDLPLFDILRAARQWYHKGYRTLEEVKKYERNLSDTLQATIRFFADIKKRIPRSEVRCASLRDLDGHRPAKVEAMETFVRRSAHQLLPGVTAICCGSYRRGKPDSVRRLTAIAHPGAPKCTPQGDCDVIITHKDPRVQDRLLNLLPELVQCARCCVMDQQPLLRRHARVRRSLRDVGFLVADLTIPHRFEEGHEHVTYMVRRHHRRRRRRRPAALVHLHGYTGPVYDPPALATVANARAAAGGRTAQAASQLLGRGAPHRYQGCCGAAPGESVSHRCWCNRSTRPCTSRLPCFTSREAITSTG